MDEITVANLSGFQEKATKEEVGEEMEEFNIEKAWGSLVTRRRLQFTILNTPWRIDKL